MTSYWVGGISFAQKLLRIVAICRKRCLQSHVLNELKMSSNNEKGAKQEEFRYATHKQVMGKNDFDDVGWLVGSNHRHCASYERIIVLVTASFYFFRKVVCGIMAACMVLCLAYVYGSSSSVRIQ